MTSRIENAELALAAALQSVERCTRHLANARESGVDASLAKWEQHLAGAQLAVAEAEAELTAAQAAPPEVFVEPTEHVTVQAGLAVGAGKAHSL